MSGIWSGLLDILQFEPDDDIEEEEIVNKKEKAKPAEAKKPEPKEQPPVKRVEREAVVEDDEPASTISRPQAAPKPQPAAPEMRRQALNRQNNKPSILRSKKGQEEKMEVVVKKPSSLEEARDIVDSLLEDHPVFLNVEGIDNYVAQRVIDFVSGACYALNGNLQKVANFIFLVTPETVDISGDLSDIMEGIGLNLMS